MTKEFGPREKFFALNGLVCLVQSLEGKITTVDLRNESSVYGKIDDVDVFMNINMSDAVFISGSGKKYKFDNYYVQARNVRYVHIPQEETELHYSPSRWGVTTPAEEAVSRHIAFVTRASEEARERVPHLLNLQYGKRDGQYCDLYGTDLPEDSPVFVYIHGGYWQILSKDISAYPVIPLWQAGVRSVIVGYDLTPKVSLDIIVEEIRDLALFIFEKAKEKGSRGIWFGGHSAGAHLAACLLQADWFNSVEPQLRCKMKGVVLISGIYDITPLIYTSNNEALQLDRKSALRLSPLFNLGATEFKEDTKSMMVIAEYDSPTFHGQTKSFSQKILMDSHAEVTFMAMEQVSLKNVTFLDHGCKKSLLI